MQQECQQFARSKRGSRTLQISLRTMLLAILLLSVPLARFATRLRTARAQQRTVKELHSLGGACFFDYQMVAASAPQPVPKVPLVERHWSDNLLGEDIWSNVVAVEFYSREVDNKFRESLVAMGQGRQIEWAAGLPSSSRRKSQPKTKRTSLFPSKTEPELVEEETVRFDDNGVRLLARLPNLETLNLGYTHVTDAGLVHLVGLNKLKELRLQGTEISDVGMECIGKLTQLRVLELNYTLVSDEGMMHLKHLKDLETLRVWGTKVGDDGIERLTSLRNLRTLSINDTFVTDGVIESLKLMPSLEHLNLRHTRVTPTGLLRIRESLPNCLVRPEF